MRTVLSHFCEEFESVVNPLLHPLKEASEILDSASDGVAARRILPGLRDNRHQLQTLAAKVGEQQAYVLIFGPLKSGKSTLMNAMSAAYVSEVTSLPAYPCMVYVSHSETRELSISRYNGAEETLSDLAALRMSLNRAHTELAERIRQVEEQGEEFDPGLHFPNAIRRVDVRVPAGDLSQSGAVLVDTPGLYTRMKFGYDRMTREFRDTAACAIFVVKTENLFLEQVFAEFTELLQLFSRIFLVVNLDTSKQDLRPDGSLVPSLEHDDPIRIIEAFENLSMSAPLKAAADEGRLRIYPVDLLRAASHRLASGEEAVAGEEGLQESNVSKQADFDAFLHDLTDYLNSTDYLVAFLGDSLRHAGSLLRELRQYCGHESVLELVRQVEGLEARKESAMNLNQRLERMQNFGWDQSYVDLARHLQEFIYDEGEDIREKTWHALSGALDAWFGNDSSLKTFLDDQVSPLLASCQNELAMAAQKALRDRTMGKHAGANLPADLETDLTVTGIDMATIGRKVFDQVDIYAGVQGTAPGMKTKSIPVRKSFWDWVLFRSMTAVQKKVFGPEERPTNRIAKTTKARRLGDQAKRAMRSMLDDYFKGFYPRALERLTQSIFSSYSHGVIEDLQRHLTHRKTQNEEVLGQISAQLEEVSNVRGSLSRLEEAASEAQNGIDLLAKTYSETDPEELVQPVEAAVSELESEEELYLEET